MTSVIKQPWTEAEVSTLEQGYLTGIPVAEIAYGLNRTERSVRGKAFGLSLAHHRRVNQSYSLAEDALIRVHAQSLTRAEIARVLGRTEGSITQRGRRLGVEFRNSLKNASYEKNHDFFRVPGVENSYLAGLLAADGWVRPQNGENIINQVGISLKRDDVALLDYIREVTGYTGVIRDYSVQGHLQSELRISGVPGWIRDLKKHWNVVPNKSYILRPPKASLTDDQLRAYLVGFIEGDGYIAISGGTLRVSVVTASAVFADWLEQVFADISMGKPARSLHKNGNAHYVDLHGANARHLCAQLMAVGVHRLNRKWSIAESEIAKHGRGAA